MSCVVYIDRRTYVIGEPISAMLVNTSNTPLRLGSWGVVDEGGRVVYSIEPPQVVIGPGSSIAVIWFQVDNEGRQVGRGRYRLFWRPTDGGLECLSDPFEIS